jgi:hypothetical protein
MTHATLQLVPGAMPSQLWAMPGREMAVVLQPHGVSGSGGYHALHQNEGKRGESGAQGWSVVHTVCSKEGQMLKGHDFEQFPAYTDMKFAAALPKMIGHSDPTSDHVHFTVLQSDVRSGLSFLPIKTRIKVRIVVQSRIGPADRNPTSDRIMYIILYTRSDVGSE